jgi:hypothetical protein
VIGLISMQPIQANQSNQDAVERVWALAESLTPPSGCSRASRAMPSPRRLLVWTVGP